MVSGLPAILVIWWPVCLLNEESKAMDSSLYYDIIEAGQSLPYPVAPERIDAMIASCGPGPAWRVLDLACGQGELLCRWSHQYEVIGTGVDEAPALIEQAQLRADALQVWASVNFVASEVAEYPQPFHQYDLVSCLNPASLGTDLVAGLATMQQALKTGRLGWLLIGESFWHKEPDPDLCAAYGIAPQALPTLPALLDAVDSAGAELAEMLLATPAEWDAFYGQQWRRALDWLEDDSEHPEWAGVQAALHESRRRYLRYERDTMGWGIFLLRMKGDGMNEGRADREEDSFDGF